MSTVDVVVVVHNHASTLGTTLSSLRAQTLPPRRVVVVDNASTDDSRQVATGAGAGWLELLGWEENRGFAAAANAGMRCGSSPFVLSLNPDCRLAPDFLSTLLAAASARPSAGSASGLLLRGAGETLSESRGVDSAGIVASAAGRHFDRGAGRPLDPALLQPAWVFGASGACALLRRAALGEVAYPGGEVFDEGFFAYREDADLAWRLQRRGWSCLYWPAARAWHGRGLRPEAGRRGHAVINRWSVRNRFLMLWANADWRWRLACFPWWFVRDLVVVGACLSVETSSWPGVTEAWRRRAAQRQRGRLNARRATVSGWELARWCRPRWRARPVEG